MIPAVALLVSALFTGPGPAAPGPCELILETDPSASGRLMPVEEAYTSRLTYRTRMGECAPASSCLPGGPPPISFRVTDQGKGLDVVVDPPAAPLEATSDPMVSEASTRITVRAKQEAPAFKGIPFTIEAGSCMQKTLSMTPLIQVDYRPILRVENVRVDPAEPKGGLFTLLLTSHSNGPTRVVFDLEPARVDDPGSQWAEPATHLLPFDPHGSSRKAHLLGTNLTGLRSSPIRVLATFDGSATNATNLVIEHTLPSHLSPREGIVFKAQETPGQLAWVSILALAWVAALRRRGPTP